MKKLFDDVRNRLIEYEVRLVKDRIGECLVCLFLGAAMGVLL